MLFTVNALLLNNRSRLRTADSTYYLMEALPLASRPPSLPQLLHNYFATYPFQLYSHLRIPPCYYYIINYTGATGSISSNESMAAASMVITSFVTGGKEFDACLLLTSTSASAETTHNLNLYLLMVVNLLALDLYLEWDLPLELNLEMAIKGLKINTA